MKFLVIVLIVMSIAYIQAQAPGQSDSSSKTLPKGIIPATKEALKISPPAATPQQAEYAINHPFATAADAAAFFNPQFGPEFHKLAGFNIPLNPQLFATLLKEALQNRRLDKVNITSIVIASLRIPPSGVLKKLALHLVNVYLCEIVQSGLLPGLEYNIPFIMHTLTANNQISNGLGKALIDGASNIPFIGRLLENAGKNIYGSMPGFAEALRVFRDDPSRFLSALSNVNNNESSWASCRPVAFPQPNLPLPQPGHALQPNPPTNIPFPPPGPFPQPGLFPQPGQFPQSGPFPQPGQFPQPGSFPQPNQPTNFGPGSLVPPFRPGPIRF